MQKRSHNYEKWLTLVFLRIVGNTIQTNTKFDCDRIDGIVRPLQLNRVCLITTQTTARARGI